MEFLQRTPFFRLLLPIIAGILLFQYSEILLWCLFATTFVALPLLIIPLFVKSSSWQYRFRWFSGCGVSLFLTCFSFFLCQQTEERNKFDNLDKKGIFLVEVTNNVIEKERSYLCKVQILNYSDSIQRVPSQGNAYIYFQKDSLVSKLLYGDRLLIATTFSTPENMKNPDGFDYASYLKQQGVGGTAYVPTNNWEKVGESKTFSIKKTANKCRNYLLALYKKFDITNEEFSVLGALTLGYTDELQPDLRQSYNATGVAHILSVSGLHVGIFYAVLAFLFGFLNKNRRQKIIQTIIIITFIWAYAFITGLSPAVLRSALMFSLVAIGTIFTRKSQIYNTIFMSAFVMLLINPNYLFNVGFQLSYTAVFSIVYFQPKISRLFSIRNKFLKLIWDLTAVSLAAQIGVLPLSLYYFQTFPNYFFLTNLIAIPLATIILYLGLVLLAVSFIPYVSIFIATLLDGALLLLNTSIKSIESIPYSISTIAVNQLQVILLFTTIIFLAYFFYTKKYYSLIIGLCSILFTLATSTIIQYKTLKTDRLIVYASNRNSHVNLINGNQNYVYTTNMEELERTASAFWNNKKIKSPILLDSLAQYNNGFIEFKNKRILILQEDFGKRFTTETPLKVDYLIIGNNLKPQIKQLLECIQPQAIIADKTLSSWNTNEIKQMCKEKNITFHSIRSSGAFIENITN